MAAFEYPVDPERIVRRIDFLTGRAQAHMENAEENRLLHMSCASTLMRDAAALSLMLQRADAARLLLITAGRLLVQLEAPAGFLLLELGLSGHGRDWVQEFDSMLDDIRQRLIDKPPNDAEAEKIDASSRGAAPPTYQLLSMFQALRLREARGEQRTELSELIERRLSRTRSQALEATGTPLSTYLRLLSYVAEAGTLRLDKLGGNLRASLMAILTRRWELLRSAREDAHHWRLMPRPWLLLDVDLTALFSLAIRKGDQFEFPEETPLENTVFALPYRAALALQQEQDRPAPLQTPL